MVRCSSTMTGLSPGRSTVAAPIFARCWWLHRGRRAGSYASQMLSTPAVSLDTKSGRWRLASRAGVNVVEAREGVVGTDQINSYRWSVPTGRMTPFIPIALSSARALAIEPRPDLASPISDPLSAFMFVFASTPRWRSTIWALGPDGATRSRDVAPRAPVPRVATCRSRRMSHLRREPHAVLRH